MNVHMSYKKWVPVKDRHSQQTPGTPFKNPISTTEVLVAWTASERLVIMCVGEPPALNACQGLTLIVLQCVVLHKQRSLDHQLKATEKQLAIRL